MQLLVYKTIEQKVLISLVKSIIYIWDLYEM